MRNLTGISLVMVVVLLLCVRMISAQDNSTVDAINNQTVILRGELETQSGLLGSVVYWLKRIYFLLADQFELNSRETAHWEYQLSSSGNFSGEVFSRYTVSSDYVLDSTQFNNGVYWVRVREYSPVRGKYGVWSDPVMVNVSN